MRRRRPEDSVLQCLTALARFYRGGACPRAFTVPSGRAAKGAGAWTKAELAFIEQAATTAGFAVKREHAAGMRLPPDLVIESHGQMRVHVERETRGWEWNHANLACWSYGANPEATKELLAAVGERIGGKKGMERRAERCEGEWLQIKRFGDKAVRFNRSEIEQAQKIAQ